MSYGFRPTPERRLGGFAVPSRVESVLENKIAEVLDRSGPMTGFELCQSIQGDRREIWRTCVLSDQIAVFRTGVDYLRLDRRVDGYARLSPSVLRMFLTYSAVGVQGDPRIQEKTRLIESRTKEITRMKRAIAFNVVSGITERLNETERITERMCTIIAGDVAYGMAHDMPRPERGTRKQVNGSDLDLVFVTVNDVPEKFRRTLDEAVYQEKLKLLMTPHMREEIDYVVKDIRKIEEQSHFDSFPHMVACKILWEGEFLCGSRTLFEKIKEMLTVRGVGGRLESMVRKAIQFRETAESKLMEAETLDDQGSGRFLFYPAEESEEFE
jgi:hypothetical protein